MNKLPPAQPFSYDKDNNQNIKKNKQEVKNNGHNFNLESDAKTKSKENWFLNKLNKLFGKKETSTPDNVGKDQKHTGMKVPYQEDAETAQMEKIVKPKEEHYQTLKSNSPPKKDTIKKPPLPMRPAAQTTLHMPVPSHATERTRRPLPPIPQTTTLNQPSTNKVANTRPTALTATTQNPQAQQQVTKPPRPLRELNPPQVPSANSPSSPLSSPPVSPFLSSKKQQVRPQLPKIAAGDDYKAQRPEDALSPAVKRPPIELSDENRIKEHLPGIKMKKNEIVSIGQGSFKIIYALKKTGLATKKLLKNIRLRNKILSEKDIKDLIPLVKASSSEIIKAYPNDKTPISEEKLRDAMNPDNIGMIKFFTLPLERQVKISKVLKNFLDYTTEFSSSDIALILSRHGKDFIESYGKKIMPNYHSKAPIAARESVKITIVNLRKVRNLLYVNAKLRTPAEIEKAYINLPPAEKIKISKFIAQYLKDKRCRAVIGKTKIPGEEGVQHFKEEEVRPAISLIASLMKIDNEIEEAKKSGKEVGELLKIREWSDNIVVPKITDDQQGVVSKKFKHGGLQDILAIKKPQDFSKEKIKISSREMVEGMISVAQGVAAMHARGHIHRDIALRNILVTDQVNFVKSKDGKWERKYGLHFAIADLGRSVRALSGVPLTGDAPIKWLSPEEIYERESSTKSDVYTFGLTLIEAFMGHEKYLDYYKNRFFSSEQDLQQLYQYCRDMYIDKIHPDLEKVIKACLTQDPINRPSMKDVVTLLQNIQNPENAFPNLNIKSP